MDRLNLHERIFFIEFDGDVGSRQTNIRKKWSEPPIGLNDALVVFVALTACQIHRRAHEKAPIGGSPGDKSAPDLNDTGLLKSGKKRRRKAFHFHGRLTIEVGCETWKLSFCEREPGVLPLKRPKNLGSA